MALSWNEIKDRAIHFSKEWADTSNEEADAKPFLDAFFEVFGVPRKKIGTFEHKVKKINDTDGYIDLLWKGTILIEMKSRGKNLDRAFEQAKDYALGLKAHELPKYILVSDFFNFRLYDTEEKTTSTFQLPDFVSHVQLFGFISGYQKKTYKEQDPANIKAAELMGKLHDRLEEIGYTGHPLEVYLVRILFCLFAEDTTIFDKQQFQDFIEQRTAVDGSDLAARIQELFQVLNTPKEKRFKNLDEQLAEFPYVNGKLFEEILPTASFDTKMRQALLDCCYIDWSLISPAIFGSMFQSVMNPKERRNLGAHYTSETNILKLIKPLFLDNLWSEFHNIKDNKNKLPEFHKKLSTLKFLDPACGCGNFLVITYRELRLLELEILRAQYKNQMATSIEQIIWLDVDQVYGIEYEEFPARIAEVAMWLMDHQMNMQISQEFGQYFVRLPLKKSAKIVHGNALKTDWEEVVSKNDLSFILGNPPFIGKQLQNIEQKSDMENIFSGLKGNGILDYVAAWYLKSAVYMNNTKIVSAFVSTNSISQGEQAGLLWNYLFNTHHIKIHFAHRTFNWKNEARGNAAVHVVIIGFANFNTSSKRIFDYENINGIPHEYKVRNINAYLVEGDDFGLNSRTKPICNVQPMMNGSMPNDNGNLIFTAIEKENFLTLEPGSEHLFRKFVGAFEFLNNSDRYCLWLKDLEPQEMKKFPAVIKHVEGVRNFRKESTREATRKLADTPFLFGEIRQPDSPYLIAPVVSSINRKYIPIDIYPSEIVASNLVNIIPNATFYTFGIMASIMMMTWIKNVAGRLKSDWRFTKDNVYNNFPWPENPSETQVKNIEEKTQKVLDVRLVFPNSSLADLYDPLTMPPALVKAHNDLDKAVDQAYRTQPFISEAKRIEFLFELYEKYTADLFTIEKKKKK